MNVFKTKLSFDDLIKEKSNLEQTLSVKRFFMASRNTRNCHVANIKRRTVIRPLYALIAFVSYIQPSVAEVSSVAAEAVVSAVVSTEASTDSAVPAVSVISLT